MRKGTFIKSLDQRILQQLQDDFPVCEDPYAVIASRLGIDPDELYRRVIALLQAGIIRRLGASIDSAKFGFAGTLAAISVPPKLVERAARLVGSFTEVTHSYLRRDRFNIWFAIIAKNQRRTRQILAQIARELSLRDGNILDLPAEQVFKLDTRFQIPRQVAK
jgi:DNA-binding Lrp family transcriptional regulator